MTPRKSHLDENRFGGAWSREKLDCVQNYIERYLEVMTNQTWADLWYIDAFSGDGFQRLKGADDEGSSERLFSSDGYSEDVQGLITGSALRAVESSVQSGISKHATFAHYVFIELSEGKLERLRDRIGRDFPEELSKCQFIPDDVNKGLPDTLAKIGWHKGRALCFIDPFATQLKWTALESFKGTKADVWLLSPLSAITRQLPRDRMPRGTICNLLDDIFGDGEWRSIYHESTNNQLTLFDSEKSTDEQFERERGVKELVSYMTTRYETIFPSVLGPAILRTANNAPLFSLYGLIANESSNARKIAGRIMRHLLRSIGGD